MKTRALMSLVGVELKKLYRDPTTLAVMLAMPIVLTMVFYLTMSDLPTWWMEGTSHFEFLVPGTMGIAVIYMVMMVAMGLCTYRDAGLLKRLETTPASATIYLGSQIVANMIIGACPRLDRTPAGRHPGVPSPGRSAWYGVGHHLPCSPLGSVCWVRAADCGYCQKLRRGQWAIDDLHPPNDDIRHLADRIQRDDHQDCPFHAKLLCHRAVDMDLQWYGTV